MLLVDDHAIVREGLRTVLSRDRRLEVVGEAGDGKAACDIAAVLRPHVVIMDLSMPHLTGVDATRCLLRVSPDSQVVVLTAHEEPPYVREALAAGARGYVLKRGILQHLCHAVHVVANGGLFVDPELAQRPVGDVETRPDVQVLSADLTTRELDVAVLAVRGKSNVEIGDDLQISVKTVETHKTHLMAKLGFRTRAQLVRYGIYRGWLAP